MKRRKLKRQQTHRRSTIGQFIISSPPTHAVSLALAEDAHPQSLVTFLLADQQFSPRKNQQTQQDVIWKDPVIPTSWGWSWFQRLTLQSIQRVRRQGKSFRFPRSVSNKPWNILKPYRIPNSRHPMETEKSQWVTNAAHSGRATRSYSVLCLV